MLPPTFRYEDRAGEKLAPMPSHLKLIVPQMYSRELISFAIVLSPILVYKGVVFGAQPPFRISG